MMIPDPDTMTPCCKLFLSGHRATVLLLGLLLSYWSIAPARAATLVGGDFAAGVLYDIDSANGTASNPRPTGLYQMAGFTVTPDGQQAYALTTFGGPQPNGLFRIDLATGAATFIGNTGLNLIGEGDLAFRPSDGRLFSVWNAVGGEMHMFTIDTTTGAATDVGMVALAADLSGLAFGPNGALYCFENFRERLLVLDPATGGTFSTINLSGLGIGGGEMAGLAYDTVSGTMYLAGGANPSHRFGQQLLTPALSSLNEERETWMATRLKFPSQSRSFPREPETNRPRASSQSDGR